MLTSVHMTLDGPVCGICYDHFLVFTIQIKCDFCKTFFHRACVEVNKIYLQVKQDCASLKWFCKECTPLVKLELDKINRQNLVVIKKSSKLIYLN